MPRTKGSVDAGNTKDEPEKHVKSDEGADIDKYNEREESAEEEVEYEEVEEEEEIEEEVEEEVEVEDDAQKGSESEDEEDVKKKHAELLALPPHGSEVYLGGIPIDSREEDLKHFCGSVGEVIEVRILRGKSPGDTKGYAFVTFRSRELASKAIEVLNNTEFQGWMVRCSTSQENNRLFIGNVPRNWEEEDMRKAVMKIGPGVIGLEFLKDPQNENRNRGFTFIEYYNHACAEYSKKKMSNPKFKLDDNAPTVSWADPKTAGSASTSQVKALYVKNLPSDITQGCLQQLFEHHGKVTKVVIPPAKLGHENSRFAFVHFAERSSAMNALKNTEKYEIGGQILDCSLAKPQADQKSSKGQNSQKPVPNPTFPPRLGYGASLVGRAYDALAAGYDSTGFSQPMIYGGGATPGGMAMFPMLLPDGRIGYILQQPGLQPQIPQSQPCPGRGGPGRSGPGRGGRGARSSSGGRRDNESNRGGGRSRFNPY